MTHSHKDLFRIMFQYARNEVKHRDDRGAKSAFDAADRATSAYFWNFGYKHADLEDVMQVSNAVLWAIHWTLFATPPKNLWGSERRRAFVMGPRNVRTWLEKPNLPA